MTALAHRQIDALPAAPQVWILTKGEMSEGGNVLGVYATRDAAKGPFLEAAHGIPFAIDKAWQEGDGSVHAQGGCDWVSLEPYDVIGLPQLTA